MRGHNRTVGRAVRLGPTSEVERVRYVLDQCRGKAVLHLGCVDHPFLEERIASGNLLHAALAGQYLFEQTFHLPVSIMHEPDRSPLRLLEAACRRTLMA